MGYFSVETPKTCDRFATDHPGAETSVSYLGKSRTVKHYYGNCSRRHATLHARDGEPPLGGARFSCGFDEGARVEIHERVKLQRPGCLAQPRSRRGGASISRTRS